MERAEFYSLTAREKRSTFFQYAEKLGLVKDGHYISGIPKGSETDVNFFYLMEDVIGYPQPCKIPDSYLTKEPEEEEPEDDEEEDNITCDNCDQEEDRDEVFGVEEDDWTTPGYYMVCNKCLNNKANKKRFK